MLVIPNGEVRKIKHLRVFFVTATWSIFAYVWLYMILAVLSPGVVDVWEAIVTLMFFPTTVFSAYFVDRRIYKYYKKSYRMNRRGVIVEAEALEMNRSDDFDVTTNNVAAVATDDNNTMMTTTNSDHNIITMATTNDDDITTNKQDYLATLKQLRNQHPCLDLESLERLAHEQLLLNRGHKSRAFYRIQATRKLMGSGDLLRRISDRAMSDLSEVKAELQRENETMTGDRAGGDFNVNGRAGFGSGDSMTKCRAYLDPSTYRVLESCGLFDVRVKRSGDDCDAQPLTVNYSTVDGTAIGGSDYVTSRGQLHFGPGVMEKRITLEVIDDDVFESDEYFYLKLTETEPEGCLGEPSVATIVILDDDHGGVFKFPCRDHVIVESVGTFELTVQRCSGARGRVVLPYWTEDGTAKGGKEYESQHGQLTFENNESE